MQRLNGQLAFSPTDLTRFQASPYDTWMQRLKLDHPDRAPAEDEQDPLMALLGELGNVHESARLERFRRDGLTVIEIDTSTSDKGRSATLTALRSGVDIIAQARLEERPFAGFSDFLVRVPGASSLGDWHYEIWDAKLARSAKPQHLIQLCAYAEMLAADQGRLPEQLAVALGSGETARFDTRDYFASYRAVKHAFFHQQEQFDPEQPPDPANFREWGKWSTHARSELFARDHLLQVANISFQQINRLQQHGIDTLAALAECETDQLRGIAPSVLQRLKAQARIQLQTRREGRTAWALLEPPRDRIGGLALLPAASANDLYFDIEGFPLEDGGLEYLWGVSVRGESGQLDYYDWWAHDHAEEAKAFEAFVRFAHKRWKADPSLHIYHYAAYEISALQRMMNRHRVVEAKVDELLRHEVFVDLYRIVRESLLLGEERYSIKNVEHLYRQGRDSDIGSGGDSVIGYQHWREAAQRGEQGRHWQEAKSLRAIREYNIDDCESTAELTAWLRQRQQELGIDSRAELPLDQHEVQREVLEREALAEKLFAIGERLGEAHADYATVCIILAQLLDFHRREDRPKYWRRHARLESSEEELYEDAGCIAGLRCNEDDIETVETSRGSRFRTRYRFDTEQELKRPARSWYVPGLYNDKGYALKVSVDDSQSDVQGGELVLRSDQPLPQRLSLVPDEIVHNGTLQRSLYRTASAYLDKRLRLGQSAILDLLARRPPRIRAHDGGAIAPAADPVKQLDAIIQAVRRLDRSYLAIQGPPGAGKTYTAVRMIAALLKDGRSVAISSNSHQAINHLLIGVARYTAEASIHARFACARNTSEAIDEFGITVLANNAIAGWLNRCAADAVPAVVGTTSWGLSREELSERFDTLFVDEAGQVSLANFVAMAGSASNLVLLGDPMQLAQPSEGAHPGESGLSALDYIMQERATMPEERGVFLATTWRMHPQVNQLVSEQVYRARLRAHPLTAERRLGAAPSADDPLQSHAGIVYVPVAHRGNTQSSSEEAEVIARLAESLLHRTLIEHGKERRLEWRDFLFVAPFNLQVNTLQHTLGDAARVGSVDRFQGQEAPIVFLSLCASDANESARGLSFLLDRHRLNVALSRAQVLAVVVGNPDISRARASSIDQLRELNFFNAIIEAGSHET